MDSTIQNIITQAGGIVGALVLIYYRLNRLEREQKDRFIKFEEKLEAVGNDFVSKELLAEKFGRLDEIISDVKKDVDSAHDKLRKQ